MNVDIVEITCTCRRWQMFCIPYKHVCTIILFISQNVVEFIDDMFKLPARQLVYLDTFCGIEMPNTPKVNDDGVVQDVIGNAFFSLKSLCTMGFFSLAGHNRHTCKNPLA